jgi:hypothetical protein
MALITCIECGKEISDKAASCPQCGVPQAFNSAHGGSSMGTLETRRYNVSFGWTFLFGCFYLFYKGWFKSGLVHAAIALLSGGIGWLVAPFFAQKVVDYFEN